jgi:hypothetical protein
LIFGRLGGGGESATLDSSSSSSSSGLGDERFLLVPLASFLTGFVVDAPFVGASGGAVSVVGTTLVGAGWAKLSKRFMISSVMDF